MYHANFLIFRGLGFTSVLLGLAVTTVIAGPIHPQDEDLEELGWAVTEAINSGSKVWVWDRLSPDLQRDYAARFHDPFERIRRLYGHVDHFDRPRRIGDDEFSMRLLFRSDETILLFELDEFGRIDRLSHEVSHRTFKHMIRKSFRQGHPMDEAWPLPPTDRFPDQGDRSPMEFVFP